MTTYLAIPDIESLLRIIKYSLWVVQGPELRFRHVDI